MATPLRLVVLLALGGCTLVDQTTFNANAGKLQVEPPPPGPVRAAALLTIDFTHPGPVYEIALRQAVDLAVARKPDVAFAVTTVVPTSGTAAQQVASATALNPDARAIARVINDQGVDQDRITLSAASEPDAPGPQIRVFVH